MPHGPWACELLKLGNFFEEKLHDLQSELWLLLKHFICDINEATMRKDLDAIVSESSRGTEQCRVVPSLFLQPYGPKAHFVPEHLTQIGKFCEEFEIRVCLAVSVMLNSNKIGTYDYNTGFPMQNLLFEVLPRSVEPRITNFDMVHQ